MSLCSFDRRDLAVTSVTAVYWSKVAHGVQTVTVSECVRACPGMPPPLWVASPLTGRTAVCELVCECVRVCVARARDFFYVCVCIPVYARRHACAYPF